MRGWRFAVVLAVGLASSVVSAQTDEENQTALTEIPMESIGRAVVKVPPEYGRLATVAVSSDVHYLYFQDQEGTVRIVAVGQRSAGQRARSPLQLLVPQVHVIERGHAQTQGSAEPQ